MGFKMINEPFICSYCGKENDKHPTWSARNHCKYCLCSCHLDDVFPGDRASKCAGKMEPTAIDYQKNKGYQIVHRCEKCGKESKNQVAPDDDFLSFVQTINAKRLWK